MPKKKSNQQYAPVRNNRRRDTSKNRHNHQQRNKMSKVEKNWQHFPGRNRIYCDGRIIMARQIGVFLFTLGLIVVCSALFFAFDCVYLGQEVSPALPAVGFLQFLFVLAVLLRTSFSDPGVIPRATEDEAACLERQVHEQLSRQQQQTPGSSGGAGPRVREISINGISYRLKYCYTCRIFRPPRASHCSICDNCVERFDHHCPWVGNCVGRRNYRYFYLFVGSLSVYCVYIFACVTIHLVLRSQKTGNFITAIRESPPSVLVAIVCFFSVWSVVGLAGFHSYLVATEQTTNEDIKGSFSGPKRGNARYPKQTAASSAAAAANSNNADGGPGADPENQGKVHSSVGGYNPFSKGGLLSNCCAVVCGPLPPSALQLQTVYIPPTVVLTSAPQHLLSTATSSPPYTTGSAAQHQQQQDELHGQQHQLQSQHHHVASSASGSVAAPPHPAAHGPSVSSDSEQHRGGRFGVQSPLTSANAN